ncbi:calcium-dependent protein kinase, putative [Cryptosporidium muris RN66]|uniref:non-specific serine/threonine protein kinase n=1 Tax=Cryptosporidium muris (strain RN66) TaxID=441375 RepID=B6AAE6_CRYMR|nr:calcium-dependent protein kinase, putative [Cryptosporidium muris RN66]EEA05187.1 calcium-dependent protein kinase, putative [Cryptosporidium muris RN66]|eukprot:XP_002139536.1 calcium-dependent protein kinase [Cryptosporidium muris RN66]
MGGSSSSQYSAKLRNKAEISENEVHKVIDETSGGTAVMNQSRISSIERSSVSTGMFVQSGSGSFAEKYSIICLLGKGSFGEVIKCKDRVTSTEYAVKVINKQNAKNKDTSTILKEVDLLKKLDHPNIMKLFEILEDSNSYYIVSELYTGGELFDEIIKRKRFSEIDAARIIKQVFSGVTYMHKHSIVHRDLKPENILLQSKEKNCDIKVIDFGLSTCFQPNTKMRDRIGTAYYIAPEVLRGTYDEKCDIWSMGVILYILLSGTPPFYGRNEYDILKRVETGKYAFDLPQWKSVSEEAKDLIRKMLTFHPSLRISAAQCLEHSWIQKYAIESPSIDDLPSLESAMTNIQHFQAEKKLAQAALLYMASRLTTHEETKKLTDIFRKLDLNNDGMLDRNELIRGYQDFVRLKDIDSLSNNRTSTNFSNINIEEQVDSLMPLLDMDKSGSIGYSEFVTCAIDRNVLLSKERMERAFQMFDKDGSGKISTQELFRLFSQEDDKIEMSELKKIIKQVDKNNDGGVDFNEFVEMLQNLVPCSN